MAWIGGVGGSGGSGGRHEMPVPLATALVLAHALFAVTVVGGLGLLMTAGAYDALDGQVIALVAYAAAPGVLGWWLARRSWEGGVRIRRGLLAVQGWLILGGVVNLVSGSARGGLQLLLPILILFFLYRPESRQWYGLAEPDRVERRPFSLSRLIRWRRDEGQTAVEYAGFIAIVAAIITALLVSGLGTQIFTGIQSEVCKVTGMACPASTGGDTDTAVGDNNAGKNNGNNNGNGNGGTSGGTGTTGGTGTGTTTTDPDQTDDQQPAPAPAPAPADDKKDDDGCFSGVGAFFGCAGNQVKQVGQGLFVDGVWGDLTGIYDMVRHPMDTLKGIGDYGKQLGDDWSQNSKDAGKKWSDGDYGGALWDWAGASVKTGGTVLYDVFIGDDVAKDWNNGDKTRAVSHVLWNVGSLFIPGYDGAKVVEKLGDLGKIGKLGKLGKFAEEASKAAEDAKKAAKAGDVEGAEKAAKEADDAADAAEKKARESGCTIGAPARRIPYGGSGGPALGGTGTGTTVLAAGAFSPYVFLAEDGCDEDAKKEAEEARKEEREAYLAKKRAEEPGRAAKAAAAKKEYPDPKHDDTSDPRNYNPPDWAADLKNHPLGSADNSDGFWASRDRNPAPNWKNESWLRYQEQVTGTVRGEEYVVPYPKKGVPDVEYDGWDAGRQTYLEAKNGYEGYLSKSSKGELTPSAKAEFAAEARRQVAAAGGKAVEWHFSNPDVAKAARRAFRDEGLDIKVVYEKQKPVGGARKPGAFG
ncbi:restriction endonuclease fold toxin 5 domain-containing protein [Streptomyces sp. NBC_01288]|uniref:Tox-REase-5 domain-containing protein n=1 Tax=Streptomyces sp. NBC_01288 TaxID=2903814 RepID=UPI002E0EA994|nr:restriction endonuclease fold toxin 5 domain-containing protein [Streptomyces sp. NBC_01288]